MQSYSFKYLYLFKKIVTLNDFNTMHMKKMLYMSLLCSGLAFTTLQPAAAIETPAVERQTDGNTLRFKFEGRDAFLKIPAKPLPGNPWVWRAYFPSWHTEMDDALYQQGYHIAYINTSDMFGSPEAMAVWDRFYGYLVNHHQLATQVVLEGVSRGGLYVHTWAKRNPTKVACIYAEVPVCDFTTWPKEVSPHDWELLKKAYRFASDEEAIAYKDMPIHNLTGLGALEVPILHSINLTDQIVPPLRNSMTFGHRYLQAGGPYAAIPMEKAFNVKQMKGHHFYLERIDDMVDFMQRHSYPVKSQLAAKDFHELNGATLLRSKAKALQQKELNVAFFGGSITFNPGWRNHLEAYFRSRFPDAKLNFLMAGIPSLGSVPHAFRFQTDVLDKMTPDILFYESVVNDDSNGYPVSDQQKSIEGIIRNTLKVNPNADIIEMYFADPSNQQAYKEGKTTPTLTAHQQLDAYYHIPVVNIAKEVAARIANKEFTWKDDIKDLHPSPYGQEIYSATMRTLLDTLMAHTPADLPMLKKAKLPKPLHKVSYDHARYVSPAAAQGTFQLSESYRPTNGQSTRAGFVDVPMLIGEKVGEKATFAFKGNAVGICIISGADAGKIRYRVDHKPYQEVDLYTHWSHALHLPWYLVLDDQLKEGKHTLELEILADTNPKSQGHACRIVHFLVNQQR